MHGDIVLRPLRPAQGQVHALSRALALGWMFRALVECHDDVRTEGNLDLHRTLGAEEVRRSVNMRAKGYAFFGQLAQLTQGENLEAAGVRKHAAVPGHEPMKSSKFADVLMSRPKIKMVGVAEDDLSAEFFENVLRHSLDARDRADGHEDGRFNDAVGQLQAADTRFAIGSFDCEFQGHCFDCNESDLDNPLPTKPEPESHFARLR